MTEDSFQNLENKMTHDNWGDKVSITLTYLIDVQTNKPGALVLKLWKLKQPCNLQFVHYILCAQTAPEHGSTASLQTRQQVHVCCIQHFQDVFLTNLQHGLTVLDLWLSWW
jgi:hypothetical protein